MVSGTSFHKIWVIESLPAGDLKTGRNLVENQLRQAKHRHPDLAVAFTQPDSKEDMLHVLATIRDEARHQGLGPMIHFECHGCHDGLQTANGEFVLWEDLRQLLIEINQACRVNLVIVLAACNGAHLIKVASKLDRAPFWAIIGPDKPVTAGDLERDVGAFYAKFFESLDADESMAVLNQSVTGTDRKYHFLSAVGLFMKAFASYHKHHCVGRGRRLRVERLVSETQQHPEVARRGVAWARKQIKAAIADDEPYFNEKKTAFFFIDQFPENAVRFPVSYQEAVARPCLQGSMTP